jgi:hypothetical protein
MTINIGSSTSYQLTVPSLSETADIQVALKLLSYGSSSDPASDSVIASNSIAGYIITKSPINNPIFTGTVTLPTGTSSVAPLKFIAGTNLTTPVTGALEYDGKLFYVTPKVNNTTAGRGLIPSEQILVNSANITKTNNVTGSTLNTTSYYAFDKSIYVAANSSYFVELSLKITTNCLSAGTSPSSSGVSIFFSGPSGVTIALDAQNQFSSTTFPNTSAPTFTYISDTSTTSVHTGSRGFNQTRYSTVKWSGIVNTANTAGNIGPKISLSARGSDTGGPDGGPDNSSASFTLYPNSYIKVTPIGTPGAEINIGGWA